MKKSIAILLSVFSISSFNVNVFAEEMSIEFNKVIEIKEAKKNRIQLPINILPDDKQIIKVDDKQLELKDKPLVYENRLYLPVRDLGEALGIDIEYDNIQKVVSLDNGKILLPVNENKAVVNGQIVAIDKDNEKVGTISLNGKTYLPLSFIAENFTYSVHYEPNTKTTSISTTNSQSSQANNEIVKLDKNQAVEIYKQLSEVSENIKNATVDTIMKANVIMNDGTNNLSMNVDAQSTSFVDIKDKVNLYAEQKNTVELLGEKETVVQKMFYQDDKLYIDQTLGNENMKLKMDLNLDEAMQKATLVNTNDLLTEEIVLDGTVENLSNGNKQYTFNLDMSKVLDISKELSKDLIGDFTNEDFKTLESMKIQNTNFVINVDDKNQPIDLKVALKISLKVDEIDMLLDINLSSKYKNVGTTVVNIPNEDLSKYEDLSDLVISTLEETSLK